MQLRSLGVDRPDVGHAYPAAGPDHGFQKTYEQAVGSVRVCVYVVGAVDPPPAPNAPDKDLGCKNATVSAEMPAFGAVDTVTAKPGAIELTGWVINPTSTNGAELVAAGGQHFVAVYINGENREHLQATELRPDVNAAFAVSGNHGYTAGYDVPAGPATVCVYALNAPTNDFNPLISCQTVDVPSGAEPIGSFDAATPSGPDGVELTGWMINPNNLENPGRIAVYVDGVGRGNAIAGSPRPDVAAIYPEAGVGHGFDIRVGGLAAGQHTVCVYALNWPTPVNNPLLGCEDVIL